MQKVTQLGHTLMRSIALSLLPDRAFPEDRDTNVPLILFDVVHDRLLAGPANELSSVGEHAEHGLLTNSETGSQR